MGHCDPDALTLSALGEPTLAAADVEHLMGCRQCSDGLRGLRRTVLTARGESTGRAAADDGTLTTATVVEPPPQVWDAIVAELGLRTAAGPAPAGRLPRGGAAPLPRSPSRVTRWLAVAAGATVLALAAGATGAVLADRGEGRPGTAGPRPTADPGPTAAPLAQAALGPLPEGAGGSAASGSARLLGGPADRSLEVQVSGLPVPAGYYEVWLLDPVSGAMVSLGVLPDSATRSALRVPGGIDVTAYDVVDVSDEPLDGDPTHSRVSVARGTLTQG